MEETFRLKAGRKTKLVADPTKLAVFYVCFYFKNIKVVKVPYSGPATIKKASTLVARL